MVIYMGDVLVFSRNVQEHSEQLRRVLGLLREKRWYVRRSGGGWPSASMFLQMRRGCLKDDKMLGELFFKMSLDRNHKKSAGPHSLSLPCP